MIDEQIKQCQKCAILEKEIENIKKDVEEVRIDMKVFQRMNQEMELKFGKFETFMTEKFLHITNKLDEITQRMEKDSENKKGHKMTFLSQFVYPGIYSLILVYVAFKLSK